MVLGREVHFFREVNSTNDVARELARRRNEGTVVVAATQSRGRGRIGRRWSSPKGGLWMSVVVRPRIPARSLPLLTLIASTAVAKSISELGLTARTRWPNDVLVGGRKIAGILAETGFDSYRTVVLGMGINSNLEVGLFPEAFRSEATSVQGELGRAVSNHALMKSILGRLDRYYSRLIQGSIDDLLQEWRMLSLTIGRRVEVVCGDRAVRGLARDISEDGSLLVETEGGGVEVASAGECRVVI